jgi:hypothetical protein
MSEQDILTRALTLLAELLAEGQPVQVRIERDGHVAELRIGNVQAPQASEALPPTLPVDMLLSPIEKSILAVATAEWQTAATFAAKTGQRYGQLLYAVLGNLVSRGLLDSGRNGYRLGSAKIEAVTAVEGPQGLEFSPVEQAIMDVMHQVEG